MQKSGLLLSGYWRGIIRFFLWQIFAIAFNGCILSKDDPNYVEIDKTLNIQNIGILHYNYSGIGASYPVSMDTFWLDPADELRFQFKGGKVMRVQVKVDENLVLEKEGLDFRIEGSKYSLGAHVLEITQIVQSGTGSLADLQQAEGVALSKSFVLMIGNVSFTPEIVAEVKNGTLQLRWNRYHRGDFQSYKIRKYNSFGSSSYYYREFLVTSQTQTMFDDNTFIGSRVTFVLIVDRGGEHFESDPVTVEVPFRPNAVLTRLDGGRARLSWDPSPFQTNVKTIDVIWINNGLDEVIGAELSPNETSVEFDFDKPFGLLYSFSIRLNANVPENKFSFDRVSSTEFLMCGKRVPAFSDILYHRQEEAYYAVHKRDDLEAPIYRMDNKLKVTDTIYHSAFRIYNPDLIQSADGEHMYIVSDYALIEIGRKPFEIRQPLFTQQIFPEAFQATGVADNQFLTYTRSSNVKIADLTSRKIVLSVPVKSSYEISPDGQYFINGNSLYAFSGTGFQLEKELPFPDVGFVHFLSESGNVLIATSSEVHVYDYINDQTIRSFAFQTTIGSKAFDDASRSYNVRNFGLAILNIDDGNVVNKPDTRTFKIAGGYMFSEQGFAEKIN